MREAGRGRSRDWRPPCQPFSKSGFWVRGDSLRLHDRRADTLSAFMHVIEGTLPKAFLLENVEGLAYARKDEGLQFVLDRIQGINRRTRSSYRPHFEVLSAADFGVPQLRRRFFLVAARDGTRFRFPLPTHRAGDAGLPLLGADALLAPDHVGRPRGHRARPRGRSGLAGQVGRSPGIDPRGKQLPLAYRPRWREASLRVATPVLELSPQAGQEPPVLDHTGAAWAGNRAVPLGESATHHARALPASDIP